MTDQSLLDTAYHEASHAVAAIAVRRGLGRVSVIPNEDGRGFVHLPDPWLGTRLEAARRGDPGAQRWARCGILVYLAGQIGEELADGEERPWTNTDGDGQAALELAYALADTQEQAKELLSRLAEETECLLRQWWPAVKALAAALLEERTMSGQRAEAIVQAAREAAEQAQAAQLSGRGRDERDRS